MKDATTAADSLVKEPTYEEIVRERERLEQALLQADVSSDDGTANYGLQHWDSYSLESQEDDRDILGSQSQVVSVSGPCLDVDVGHDYSELDWKQILFAREEARTSAREDLRRYVEEELPRKGIDLPGDFDDRVESAMEGIKQELEQAGVHFQYQGALRHISALLEKERDPRLVQGVKKIQELDKLLHKKLLLYEQVEEQVFPEKVAALRKRRQTRKQSELERALQREHELRERQMLLQQTTPQSTKPSLGVEEEELVEKLLANVEEQGSEVDASLSKAQGFVADPQGRQVLEKVNAEIGFFVEMRQSDVASTAQSDASLPEREEVCKDNSLEAEMLDNDYVRNTRETKEAKIALVEIEKELRRLLTSELKPASQELVQKLLFDARREQSFIACQSAVDLDGGRAASSFSIPSRYAHSEIPRPPPSTIGDASTVVASDISY